MEAAGEIVIRNTKKLQNNQRELYAFKAYEWKLRIGDQVLVLLPTSTNKLLSQWHDSYEVTRVIVMVNYETEMTKPRRKKDFSYQYAEKVANPENDQSSMEETSLVVESEDSVIEENTAEWRKENISSKLNMENQLDRKQREELHKLLRTDGINSSQPTNSKRSETNSTATV